VSQSVRQVSQGCARKIGMTALVTIIVPKRLVLIAHGKAARSVSSTALIVP
jgi:hypothetical protein